jgi:hypothetical protein
MSLIKSAFLTQMVDPDANPLLSGYIEDFTESLTESICSKNYISNTINSKTMNQKNFEYLKDQIKFTGFGEGLENQLKEKMQLQTEAFNLSHQAKFGNDTVDATLQFRKSNQNDMYFFNSYQVNLKREDSTENTQQTFYINKGNNITLKEAFNLMSGRAVNKDLTNKEGQIYNAWIQMDFNTTETNGNYKLKQYHQNYGYDLNKELEKHPLEELKNQENKQRLMESLEKGNRQSVTFSNDGIQEKKFIEANPRFKTINVYDSHMHRLDNRQTKEEKQIQVGNDPAKQRAKNENRNAEEAGPDIPKASKKIRKKLKQTVT